MKNVVINHGFDDLFSIKKLIGAGVDIFHFPDREFSFQIKENNQGQLFIYVNGKLVIKNGKAAIPKLARSEKSEDKSQYVYLITSDKSVAVDEIDLFIPLYRSSTLEHSAALMEFLKFYDIPTLEKPEVAAICMQKIKTYDVLKEANLPIPEALTVTQQDKKAGIKEAMAFYIKKSRKIILKSNVYGHTQGIFVPNSPEELVEQIETLLKDRDSILVQERINTGKRASHINVEMCFGEIIASQKFNAKDDYLTSHIGNARDSIGMELTPEQKEICQKVAETLGFNVASLDCVISTDGEFYVLDVNVPPKVLEDDPEQADRIMEQLIEKYL